MEGCNLVVDIVKDCYFFVNKVDIIEIKITQTDNCVSSLEFYVILVC